MKKKQVCAAIIRAWGSGLSDKQLRKIYNLNFAQLGIMKRSIYTTENDVDVIWEDGRQLVVPIKKMAKTSLVMARYPYEENVKNMIQVKIKYGDWTKHISPKPNITIVRTH